MAMAAMVEPAIVDLSDHQRHEDLLPPFLPIPRQILDQMMKIEIRSSAEILTIIGRNHEYLLCFVFTLGYKS